MVLTAVVLLVLGMALMFFAGGESKKNSYSAFMVSFLGGFSLVVCMFFSYVEGDNRGRVETTKAIAEHRLIIKTNATTNVSYQLIDAVPSVEPK